MNVIYRELEQWRGPDKSLLFPVEDLAFVIESGPLRVQLTACGARFRQAICAESGRGAIGRDDGTIRIYTLTTAREEAFLSAHEAPVTAVAFSPDGRRIASGSSDTTVRVWDAGSGAELAILRGHESEVGGVAFSDNASLLASRDREGWTRLWNLGDGRCLSVLQDTPRMDVELRVESVVPTGSGKGPPEAGNDQDPRDGAPLGSRATTRAVRGLRFGCSVQDNRSTSAIQVEHELVTGDDGSAWIKGVPLNAALRVCYLGSAPLSATLVHEQTTAGRIEPLCRTRRLAGKQLVAAEDDRNTRTSADMTWNHLEDQGYSIVLSDRGPKGTILSISTRQDPDAAQVEVLYEVGPEKGSISIARKRAAFWGGYAELPILFSDAAALAQSARFTIIPTSRN